MFLCIAAAELLPFCSSTDDDLDFSSSAAALRFDSTARSKRSILIDKISKFCILALAQKGHTMLFGNLGNMCCFFGGCSNVLRQSTSSILLEGPIESLPPPPPVIAINVTGTHR